MPPFVSAYGGRASLSLLLAAMAHVAWSFPPAPSFDLDWLTAANGYRIQAVRQPASPHYFPPPLALRAAAILDAERAPVPGDPGSVHQAHWLLGFEAPWFLGGDRQIQFYDCYRPAEDPMDPDADEGCGGGFALPERIVMPAPEYRTIPESCTRMVLAHELFHHIQFGYADRAGSEGCGWIGTTACEGMARAMQDKLYLDLDRDPDASCFSGYHEEVGSYLDDPNRNLWTSGYRSALWWNYLSEQFGEETVEPQRGVDFFVRWLDLAEAAGAHPDPLAVSRQAVQQTAPQVPLQAAFQNFLLANRIKGLNLSQAPEPFRLRFAYRDEETLPGQPAPEAYPLPARSSRVVTPDAPAVFDFDARAFGAQYVDWDVSQCPGGYLLRWETRPDAQGEALPTYTLSGLVAVRGDSPGRPVRLYKNRSRGWRKDLVQPYQRFDRLLSVVAGWTARSRGELRLSCTRPAAEPGLPLVSPLRPFTPGPPDRLSVVEVPVGFDPTLPEPAAAPAALSIDDFSLQVGQHEAGVIAALPDGNGYRLQVALPQQAAAGSYPLRLQVGDAALKVEDAVHYAPLAPQLLIAVDTSASMSQGVDNALDALKAALPILFDALPDSTRVGLLDHGEGEIPRASLRTPLAPLLDGQRRGLSLAAASLSTRQGPGAALGDALRQAIDAFEQDAGAVPARHVLLISDGSQGPGAEWEDVRNAVLAAGITVHTLALGPRADQPLLDRIAGESGGSYRYVKRAQTFDGGELAATLLGIGEPLSRRVRIAQEDAWTPQPGAPRSFLLEVPILLDPPADARLQLSLFPARVGLPSLSAVSLRDPTGRIRDATFAETRIAGDASRWSISTPLQGGRWTLDVQTSSALPAQAHHVVASLDLAGQAQLSMLFHRETGHAPLSRFGIGDSGRVTLGLLLPAVQRAREAAAFRQAADALPGAGNALLLPAVQAAREAAGRVHHPDGRIERFMFAPSAEEGSGQYEDSVWSADYRRLTRGAPSGQAEDPDTAGQSGSYRLEARFRFPQPDGGSWQLLARHDFAVHADPPPDDDGDGLPNAYENAFACLDSSVPDAQLDRDEDGLSHREEYALGTHPCLADSDGGGETDGSEVSGGREPMWPDDDGLCPLEFAHQETFEPGDAADSTPPAGIALRFSSCPRYRRIEVRRASGEGAPLLHVADIDTRLHPGLWRDLDVLPGRTYRYQLVAAADGALGAPSAPFEATAPIGAAPAGSLRINEGQSRTDHPLLRIDVDAAGAASSLLIRFAVDGAGFGAWQPLARSHLLGVGAADTPRRVRVAAQLQDASGRLSASFSDSILLHPASSLAGVQLRSMLGEGQPDIGSLLWLPEARLEPQARADAHGLLRLTGLTPGRHRVQLVDGAGRQRDFVLELSPGQMLDLGVQTPGTDAGFFANGFE